MKSPLDQALEIVQGKQNDRDRLAQMLYMDFYADTTDTMSAEDWEALMEYEKERDWERK